MRQRHMTFEEQFRLTQLEDVGHVPLIKEKNGTRTFKRDGNKIPVIGTPFKHVRMYINNIPKPIRSSEATLWHTDMPEVVHILIAEMKVNPLQIWLDTDSDFKRNLAKSYGINYNNNDKTMRRDTLWQEQEDEEMKKQFTVNLINYKFSDTGPNGGRVPKSRKRIQNGLSYVQDGGYFGVIGMSRALFTAGQQSILYKLLEYDIKKIFANIDFPIALGVDISGMILHKVESENDIILYNSIDNDEFEIDLSQFIYRKVDRKFIPANVTRSTLPLVEKIIKLNDEVFEFSASSSKGDKNLIAFWGVSNMPLSPKQLQMTDTGTFNVKLSHGHPCSLGKKFPEKNVRAVFQGKWFHWYMEQLLRRTVANSPAAVSYFPKLNLSTKWTFDKLAEKIGATDEEKQIVLDWASKRNETWQD